MPFARSLATLVSILFLMALSPMLGVQHRLAAADDPAWYVRQASWHSTLLAARQALAATEQKTGPSERYPTFVSPIMRGGDTAREVRVPVAGLQELYLYVVGAPDVIGGAGNWADARLIGRDGRSVWLTEVKPLEVLAGRFSIDETLESGVSGPMEMSGRRFEHGLHVYAYSKVRVRLGGEYERFEASIGIDDWVGRIGAVRFIVTDERGAARLDLWPLVSRDFPTGQAQREMRWEQQDGILDQDWTAGDWRELARRYAHACRHLSPADQTTLASDVSDAAGLERVRQVYCESRRTDETAARAARLDWTALRLAVTDLRDTFGAQYPQGPAYLDRLDELQQAVADALPRLPAGSPADVRRVAELVQAFDTLQQQALVESHPLLQFDRLLLIERTPQGHPREPTDTGYGMGEYLGLPRQSSKCIPGIEQPMAWDNSIAVLSPVRPDGRLTPLYQPAGRRLVTDVDLHWDADRLLFTMPGSHDRWQVFEIGADGRGLRQVTPGDQPDVDNYDSCYLPSGQIAFESTAPLQGVPCNAGVIVGMTYVMNANGSDIHQVCFEQDHNYCPTVMNDGRILYLRWDYTDTPHVWNRMLFTMNPDGTGQMEYYGSNSYWPNAIFYARPIPAHPTKVVGIVTGHHVGRVGELVVFDPAQGRQETSGVVQRIPGRGQPVQPLIQDKLTEHSWPKFLHPYPLSDKYFLVACKPAPDALWGIYLADVFDNLVLVKELEGRALLEPIPLCRTVQPPVIRDRVERDREDATVYMADVYSGPGLAGVPRGTVKKLRVLTYHFGYQRIAGIDHRVGADGPWEVKRVLGTVPVEADGSALFRVPAKTPISVQPLDERGCAIALMRSWVTAMPGETVSCVGCHERRNSSPPSLQTIAARRKPSNLEAWYGPTRGFSFRRDVQPVLDTYCVGCHNGQPREDGRPLDDLRGEQNAFVVFRGGDPRGQVIRDTPREKLLGRYGGVFEPSYLTLRNLVRVGGLESDLHLLPPLEFHAGTTHLVQMLRKGHHGVQLDAEAWDRLVTWIDLNAPCHGTWSEVTPIGGGQQTRRLELQKLYCGITRDAERLPEVEPPAVRPILPATVEVVRPALTLADWPWSAEEAQRRQAAGGELERRVDLGDGVSLQLVWIPAGRFVMGDAAGAGDENPQAVVAIDKPFWLGKFEVTNGQFSRFDSEHDSRFEHRSSWIFSEEYLGWPLNGPDQPVVRVSWHQAMDFCRWLSQRTGMPCSLPTEAQWEYACRAGTATPLWYGDLESDFSTVANMADASLRDWAYQGWRPRSPDLYPRDDRFDDGALVTVAAGSYRPNPWGVCDLHGNAAEWTRSRYVSYPYGADDGRNDPAAAGQRVVRGGSWFDRPQRCRSAFRLGYEPHQRVFNVGFRVVCEPEP